MQLINSKTGAKINEGDTVTTTDGKQGILKTARYPHKPSSSGKVFVKFSDTDFCREFFPSVIDAEFVPMNSKRIKT